MVGVMNFDDINQMLYTHWAFLILMVYMAGGLTYIIYSKLPTYNVKAIKLFALTIAGGLLLFYFVIPVPVKVQDSFVQAVHNIKRENKAFNDIHTQLTMRDVCKNKYLNAYGYFHLKNSFVKDQEEAFKIQRQLSFSPYERNSKSHKYICESFLPNGV